jgi:hypothetical protein
VKNLILFLLLLTPTIARAEEPPVGIFTYLYTMGLLLPYVIFSIGLSFYLAIKNKYQSKLLAIKHTCWGLFISALGLIIFYLNPVENPFLKDVVYVFIAALIAIILPGIFHAVTRFMSK